MNDDRRQNAAKLEAAALISPIIRSTPQKALDRKVTRYKRDTGEVVGEAKYEDAVRGLLKAHELEIQVEGKRPSEIICKVCGARVKVGPRSHIPDRCKDTDGCFCACGKRTSYFSTQKAIKTGRRPMCRKCSFVANAWRARANLEKINSSKTPEQKAEQARIARRHLTPEVHQKKSDALRRAHASKTPEERSAIARKAVAALTAEQRSEVKRKMNAARSPEAKAASARKRVASMTPERRSEISRKSNASRTSDQKVAAARKVSEGMKRAWATKTPEQRSEMARKGAAKRRPKTPEQRSEVARKREAEKTPQEKSEIARRRQASRTPEQRSASARKANETRRRKAEQAK